MKLVCECGYVVNKFEVLILKDTAEFDARKIIIGLCPIHHRPILTLIERRIFDKTVFKKENIFGNQAMKILNKEYKNILHKIARIKSEQLKGFVYGINKECKDKDGNITKVEQYSADFWGTKNLIKEIEVPKNVNKGIS